MNKASNLFEELVKAGKVGNFLGHFRGIPQSQTPVHRHPLGFSVARLIADGDAALRLHMWPKNSQSPQPGFDIHDHTFDLTSFIVLGELCQTVYEIVPDATATHAVYEVSYEPTGSVLRKSDTTFAMKLKETQVLRPAETYSLPATKFHKLERISTQCAATLVLTTQGRGAPRTLGPLDGAPSIRFERSSYSHSAIDELMALIGEVGKAIQGSDG